MAGLQAAGLATGLDVNSIVSQLMAFERQPLVRLAEREAAYQAEISALGNLKSAVSQLQDAVAVLGDTATFQTLTASSSDTDVLSVSTDGSAAVSGFDVLVDRLAQRHKLASAALNVTDTFGGSAGDGLTLTVNAKSFTVDLSTAQTLNEIRDAVNAEENDTGVTAVVVNGDNGKQTLVLAAAETGYDERVQLSYQGTITDTSFSFATINQDADGNPIVDDTELDASLAVEGVTVTRGSNDIDDVVDGVALHLQGIGVARIDVARDTTLISDSVQAFVSAFNTLRKDMASLSTGQLSGDNILLSIESRIRSALNSRISVDGSPGYVQQIGLTTTDSGDLQLDTDTLNASAEDDLDGLAALFADSESGFAVKLDGLLEGFVKSDGLIASRVDGLNGRISGLESQRGALERRLVATEERLRAQFTALEQLVSQLQSTSNFLAQQLAGLPNSLSSNQ